MVGVVTRKGRWNRNAERAPTVDALIARAVAALRAGDPVTAADLAADAHVLVPDDPHVLELRGVAALNQGRVAEAIRWLSAARWVDRDNAGVETNLGIAYFAAGRLDEAEAMLVAATARGPDLATAHRTLGQVLAERGRPAEAASAFRAAIALAPDDAEAWHGLGLALDDGGDRDGAEAALRRSVALAPECIAALNDLATLLHRAAGAAESVALFERARRLSPLDAAAQNVYGAALFDCGRPADAERAFRLAIAKRPDLADAWINLGNTLCALDRPLQAVACYDRAHAVDAVDVSLWINRGHANKQADRLDDAADDYSRAIAQAPIHDKARFARALLDLARGRFDRGWQGYAARESMRRHRAGAHQRPLPDDLSRRRILIRHDQGLGDELFFLRFVARLRARGAHVTYWPDPRLAAMLTRAGIANRIADDGAGAFDYRLSVGDLPLALAMASVDDIPPAFPIPPEAACDRAVADRLDAAGPPLRIGVAWRAGTEARGRLLHKAVPLEALAHALADLPATMVILQRDPDPAEIVRFAALVGRPVLDLSGLNADLEAMLALVGRLDALVGVSNTNVHFRVARGRPCHVLVPRPPEFRWMAAGRESPWFPGSPVYRQALDGSWDAALAALRDDLAAALGARDSGQG